MTYIKTTTITPSDTTDASDEIRSIDAIMLPSGTTLKCQLWGDSAPTELEGLIAGKIYPLQVKFIFEDATDAATVIGFTSGRMGQ